MLTSIRTTVPWSLLLRHKRLGVLVPIAFGLLAGCQTRGDVRPFSSEVPLPPTFAKVVDVCNGAEARFAMGQKMTPALLEEAKNRTGARVAVTAKAGEALSPVDPLRLIVEVNPAGQMVGARCG
ncbi:hypothetical protein QTI66_27120 [Variovorax sp. J22R133]|uniref:hypothetical protein n=1 Tax=Variovorax brevis TaxID=3053503 RepID=UPI002576D8E2|nr:hypothetical protein [Variovorax sp. J22R133]MDM0115850.1 hypothetical protein [Variovorax sp. J22R133]